MPDGAAPQFPPTVVGGARRLWKNDEFWLSDTGHGDWAICDGLGIFDRGRDVRERALLPIMYTYTLATDVTVDFPTPIYGFASPNADITIEGLEFAIVIDEQEVVVRREVEAMP